MSLITNVLSVLGVVLIIVLIVYIYRKNSDKKTKPTIPDFPPDNYMQEVGTKCPDLWNLSTNYQTGAYSCVNTNNAPIRSGTEPVKCVKTPDGKFVNVVCGGKPIQQWGVGPEGVDQALKNCNYEVSKNPSKFPNCSTKDYCESTAVFSQMETWPLDPKKRQDELKNRCDWIEKCGPAGGTPASWIGIDDLC